MFVVSMHPCALSFFAYTDSSLSCCCLCAFFQPFEGYKGGGFDRSSLIRPPYHRRQLAIPSTSEQLAPLSPVHPSLQCDFRPVRRYESNLSAPCGRQFKSIGARPYNEFAASLNYLQDRGKALYTPKIEPGETSSQAIGSFWLVNNKLRPNTSPAIPERDLKPVVVEVPYAVPGYNMPT